MAFGSLQSKSIGNKGRNGFNVIFPGQLSVFALLHLCAPCTVHPTRAIEGTQHLFTCIVCQFRSYREPPRSEKRPNPSNGRRVKWSETLQSLPLSDDETTWIMNEKTQVFVRWVSEIGPSNSVHASACEQVPSHFLSMANVCMEYVNARGDVQYREYEMENGRLEGNIVFTICVQAEAQWIFSGHLPFPLVALARYQRNAFGAHSSNMNVVFFREKVLQAFEMLQILRPGLWLHGEKFAVTNTKHGDSVFFEWPLGKRNRQI